MSTPAGAERADENRYAVDSNRPAARKKPKHTNPKRGLAVLLALFLVLVGGIAATGHWTPKLGLDLEGGRTVVLEPVVTGGKSVNSSQVKQAVDIIRNRVDATGTSEAEVTTLGEKDIVVSIPGNPSQQVLDSLSRSSQLNFRAVIAAAQGSTTGTSPYRLPEVVNPSNGASGSASASPSSSASASGSASSSASSSPSSSSKDRLPAAFKTAGPANASDPAWGNEKVDSVWVKAGIATPSTTYNQLLQLYACTPAYQEVAAAAPDNKPTVMCAKEGNEKLLLGPVEIKGSQLTDASSGLDTNQQGNQTGEVAVNLSLNGSGKTALANVTRRVAPLEQPRNRFAIVVDGQSISAPTVQAPLTDGQAKITGGFTESSGKLLADSLKFGALPMSFKELTSDQVSPQLGSDQLTKGLIAGAIGLGLVVLYSLIQYRALGLVTVASLLVAAALTYLAVTLLGSLNNFRLSMAGVTGLIVAIGITADSFIVYFERVRDEVRAGRPLRAAVETGWTRAKRTIIISDAVNFLAAAVLYVLSESTVKAFAFTLGLTTIIDIVVVMFFTHPVLALLARTKFFGGGHPASGLDPARLGARQAAYAGRGRVTIADRRRAAAQEETA
ncbi:protein translocase subunit SecD [Dermacoccus nishinomiyaensis]|uniref:protein translocase subunit SecD n=1 Tax=Dermacoccus nishinomiyaensis TaxID=1274 RepID=UPI0010AC1A2E|nr:protein translocase subunit SecD [Dermacoccus nishinomiyaensis]TJZ97621.1 protein translocase subunit SecD [Dermacoccus nishinomiyaensis]